MTETNNELLATGHPGAIAEYFSRLADKGRPMSPIGHQAGQALLALALALVARREDRDTDFQITDSRVSEGITLAGMIAARHAQASTIEGRWALRAYLDNSYPDYDDDVGAEAQPASVQDAHAQIAQYVKDGIAVHHDAFEVVPEPVHEDKMAPSPSPEDPITSQPRSQASQHSNPTAEAATQEPMSEPVNPVFGNRPAFEVIQLLGDRMWESKDEASVHYDRAIVLMEPIVKALTELRDGDHIRLTTPAIIDNLSFEQVAARLVDERLSDSRRQGIRRYLEFGVPGYEAGKSAAEQPDGVAREHALAADYLLRAITGEDDASAKSGTHG